MYHIECTNTDPLMMIQNEQQEKTPSESQCLFCNEYLLHEVQNSKINHSL